MWSEYFASQHKLEHNTPKGQSKMDNPEKLATCGAQDEDKQKKNTTQYVLNTTIHKQTQTA